MKADEFLARVREAATLGRQHPVHYDHDVPANVGYYGSNGDAVASFITEANLVGGQAERVTSDAQALEVLAALLSKYGATRALCWQHPLLDRLQLARFLADKNIAALAYEQLHQLPVDERKQTLLACEVGITSCTCAVAETGSLMMAAEPGRERLASLLTPVHIAIIERSQLVPDLFDAFAQIQPEAGSRLPTNVTFITGPSKTGDLELRLVTGVHGPKHWHVIVIDPPGAA